MESIYRLDRAAISLPRYLVWLPMLLLGIGLTSLFIYRGAAAAEWPMLVAGLGLGVLGGIKVTLGRSLTWYPERRMVTESRSVLLFSWKDYFDLSSFQGIEVRVQMPDLGGAAGQNRRKFQVYLHGISSVEVGEFDEPDQAAECAENASKLLNLPLKIVDTEKA